MNIPQKDIPQATLQIVAKSFFKETVVYGFSKVDYVRFVNLLLERSFSQDSAAIQSEITHQGGKS